MYFISVTFYSHTHTHTQYKQNMHYNQTFGQEPNTLDKSKKIHFESLYCQKIYEYVLT